MTGRPSEDPRIVRRTQLVDLARSVPLGVVLPLESAVLLTIAIRHFDAPGWMRGTIAAAPGIGLLASTLLTALARRLPVPTMTVASWVIGCGAVGFALASTGSSTAFLIGVVIGISAINMNIPLLTATYESNFPAHERGVRVGRGIVLKVAVSTPLSVVMGAWLAADIGNWWVVTLAGAIAAGSLSALNRRFPSQPLGRIVGDRAHPWPRWELLRSDRTLAVLLGAWMLMGFGNLMLLPLRIDYLAEPSYGIIASATVITVVTVAIPSIVRLVTTPFFGRVFDRMSVFTLRILVNLLFIAYVAAFFATTDLAWIVVGSIVLGTAFAGGDLLWMLWVTKFAPVDRTADYMGLHTFLTGVRAVAAPLIAYAVVGRLSLGRLAAVGVALMLASSEVLVPGMIRDERARRSGAVHAGA
ncbi:MAG: MFS transporter [Ilumatobacteraceae bacterium]